MKRLENIYTEVTSLRQSLSKGEGRKILSLQSYMERKLAGVMDEIVSAFAKPFSHAFLS